MASPSRPASPRSRHRLHRALPSDVGASIPAEEQALMRTLVTLLNEAVLGADERGPHPGLVMRARGLLNEAVSLKYTFSVDVWRTMVVRLLQIAFEEPIWEGVSAAELDISKFGDGIGETGGHSPLCEVQAAALDCLYTLLNMRRAKNAGPSRIQLPWKALLDAFRSRYLDEEKQEEWSSGMGDRHRRATVRMLDVASYYYPASAASEVLSTLLPLSTSFPDQGRRDIVLSLTSIFLPYFATSRDVDDSLLEELVARWTAAPPVSATDHTIVTILAHFARRDVVAEAYDSSITPPAWTTLPHLLPLLGARLQAQIRGKVKGCPARPSAPAVTWVMRLLPSFKLPPTPHASLLLFLQNRATMPEEAADAGDGRIPPPGTEMDPETVVDEEEVDAQAISLTDQISFAPATDIAKTPLGVLRRVLRAVETLSHPSNMGEWTVMLFSVCEAAARCLSERVALEAAGFASSTPPPSFPIRAYPVSVDEDGRSGVLRREDVDGFAASVLSVARRLVFAPYGGRQGGVTVGGRVGMGLVNPLAEVAPARVSQFLEEMMTDALDPDRESALDTALKAPAAMAALASSLPPLLYPRPYAASWLPRILHWSVPGLDPTDPGKAQAAAALAIVVARHIPIGEWGKKEGSGEAGAGGGGEEEGGGGEKEVVVLGEEMEAEELERLERQAVEGGADLSRWAESVMERVRVLLDAAESPSFLEELRKTAGRRISGSPTFAGGWMFRDRGRAGSLGGVPTSALVLPLLHGLDDTTFASIASSTLTWLLNASPLAAVDEAADIAGAIVSRQTLTTPSSSPFLDDLASKFLDGIQDRGVEVREWRLRVLAGAVRPAGAAALKWAEQLANEAVAAGGDVDASSGVRAGGLRLLKLLLQSLSFPQGGDWRPTSPSTSTPKWGEPVQWERLGLHWKMPSDEMRESAFAILRNAIGVSAAKVSKAIIGESELSSTEWECILKVILAAIRGCNQLLADTPGKCGDDQVSVMAHGAYGGTVEQVFGDESASTILSAIFTALSTSPSSPPSPPSSTSARWLLQTWTAAVCTWLAETTEGERLLMHKEVALAAAALCQDATTNRGRRNASRDRGMYHAEKNAYSSSSRRLLAQGIAAGRPAGLGEVPAKPLPNVDVPRALMCFRAFCMLGTRMERATKMVPRAIAGLRGLSLPEGPERVRSEGDDVAASKSMLEWRLPPRAERLLADDWGLDPEAGEESGEDLESDRSGGGDGEGVVGEAAVLLRNKTAELADLGWMRRGDPAGVRAIPYVAVVTALTHLGSYLSSELAVTLEHHMSAILKSLPWTRRALAAGLLTRLEEAESEGGFTGEEGEGGGEEGMEKVRAQEVRFRRLRGYIHPLRSASELAWVLVSTQRLRTRAITTLMKSTSLLQLLSPEQEAKAIAEVGLSLSEVVVRGWQTPITASARTALTGARSGILDTLVPIDDSHAPLRVMLADGSSHSLPAFPRSKLAWPAQALGASALTTLATSLPTPHASELAHELHWALALALSPAPRARDAAFALLTTNLSILARSSTPIPRRIRDILLSTSPSSSSTKPSYTVLSALASSLAQNHRETAIAADGRAGLGARREQAMEGGPWRGPLHGAVREAQSVAWSVHPAPIQVARLIDGVQGVIRSHVAVWRAISQALGRDGDAALLSTLQALLRGTGREEGGEGEVGEGAVTGTDATTADARGRDLAASELVSGVIWAILDSADTDGAKEVEDGVLGRDGDAWANEVPSEAVDASWIASQVSPTSPAARILAFLAAAQPALTGGPVDRPHEWAAPFMVAFSLAAAAPSTSADARLVIRCILWHLIAGYRAIVSAADKDKDAAASSSTALPGGSYSITLHVRWTVFVRESLGAMSVALPGADSLDPFQTKPSPIPLHSIVNDDGLAAAKSLAPLALTAAAHRYKACRDSTAVLLGRLLSVDDGSRADWVFALSYAVLGLLPDVATARALAQAAKAGGEDGGVDAPEAIARRKLYTACRCLSVAIPLCTRPISAGLCMLGARRVLLAQQTYGGDDSLSGAAKQAIGIIGTFAEAGPFLSSIATTDAALANAFASPSSKLYSTAFHDDAADAATVSTILEDLTNPLPSPTIAAIAHTATWSVGHSPTWRARKATAESLIAPVFSYSGCQLLPRTHATTFLRAAERLLVDRQRDVQDAAGSLCTGLLTALTPLDRARLADRWIKQAAARLPPAPAHDADPKERKTYTAIMRVRVGAALGAAAFVRCVPYTVPNTLAPRIAAIASLASRPAPLKDVIHAILRDFRHTHHDNWDMVRLRFTKEQLDSVTDSSQAPHYFS